MRIASGSTIKTIGVGECGWANEPGQILKTHALGSCIGVVIRSRSTGLVGLLHLQLPESSLNPELAKKRPAMFADTGIDLLLKPFFKRGLDTRDLEVRIAGGSQILDPNNTFNIGTKNYLATKRILWSKRLWPLAEDVGGTLIRTLTVRFSEGPIQVSSPGKMACLL